MSQYSEVEYWRDIAEERQKEIDRLRAVIEKVIWELEGPKKVDENAEKA